MDETTDPILEKLRQIRTRTNLKLRHNRYLKDTFTDFAGHERPLTIRYYQIQAIMHLLVMKRFVLGDDTGCGKCVAKGTLIQTNRGLVPIEEMNPGNKTPDTFMPVTGWEVVTNGNSYPIRNYYHGGNKPTIILRTHHGYELEGTLVHPVLCRRNEEEVFVKTSDLVIGDYLCLDRKPLAFSPVDPLLPLPDISKLGCAAVIRQIPKQMNPDLARLLGYIVAEGWTNHKYSFFITQSEAKNPETRADIKALLKSQFDYDVDRQTDMALGVNSVFLAEFLRLLGINGTTSHYKTVPKLILQSTRESVVNFLRSLLDTESSVSTGGVEFSSSSAQLMSEVQTLLLSLGIVSRKTKKIIKGYNHVYWRLCISGDAVRIFRDVLGFISSRKKTMLDTACNKKPNPNNDIIPSTTKLVETIREALRDTSPHGANSLRTGTGLKQFGVSFVKGLNNIRHRGNRLTYQFARKLIGAAENVGMGGLESVSKMRDICARHFFYDPIVSITYGSAEVADIEVDSPDHSFTSNGFVSHNTLEAIATLCFIWESEPDRKVIVLTTKSATRQWVNEFVKFTTGVKVFTCQGIPSQRKLIRQQFQAVKGPSVLVMGYRAAVQDYTDMQTWKDFILVSDECTAFKTPTTQVHQTCSFLAANANRVWGLTATLIKNNLMEGYGIYRVIYPELFRMSARAFMLYYAIVRMQSIPKSNRMVPVIVDYSPERVAEFRQTIDMYYLGRPKHAVATELPTLTSRTIDVDMSDEQADKYAEALDGLLDVIQDGELVGKETNQLSALIYCQEIVNHLELIGCTGDSPKLDTLVDLLTSDFDGDKVIIYSRFERLISLIMDRLKKEKIQAVRVTGKEKGEQREAAMKAFQNPESTVRAICITAAGSEAINLQAAKALICIDTPWSAGDFLQLIGRMIRIGSAHDKCYVVHLVARNEGEKTIDHRVLEVLHKKMDLVEAVLGKRLLGTDDLKTAPNLGTDKSAVAELFSSLQTDAQKSKGHS